MGRSVAQEPQLLVGTLEVAKAEAAESPERTLLLVELLDQSTELGLLLAPTLLFGRVEESLEGSAHRRAVPRPRGLEARGGVGAPKAEAAGERGDLFGVARDEVGLPLLHYLQLVLDVTQEAVSGGQAVSDAVFERRSCGNGSKGPRVADWALLATASPRHVLLIRRLLSRPGDLAFYLCWAPRTSCCACTKNSTSRMPPGPSFTSRRAASAPCSEASTRRFIVLRSSIVPKSR